MAGFGCRFVSSMFCVCVRFKQKDACKLFLHIFIYALNFDLGYIFHTFHVAILICYYPLCRWHVLSALCVLLVAFSFSNSFSKIIDLQLYFAFARNFLFCWLLFPFQIPLKSILKRIDLLFFFDVLVETSIFVCCNPICRWHALSLCVLSVLYVSGLNKNTWTLS